MSRTETMYCRCLLTADGWDEAKCGYHNPASVKPFVRFRVYYMNGSTVYIKGAVFGKLSPQIVAIAGRGQRHA